VNKSSVTLTLNDIVCLSEKRRTILLLLGKKGYSIDELTEQMNMTAHSLAPQLKTLRDEEIIVLKDGLYELTNIGSILVKNMYPLFETIAVLEKDQRYWFDRNLSVIPAELTERIRDIGNYKLLEYDISEYMFDVPAEFSDNIQKSKHAMCLLSVYHPVYTEM
jgi:Predicted transcriptional regulator